MPRVEDQDVVFFREPLCEIIERSYDVGAVRILQEGDILLIEIVEGGQRVHKILAVLNRILEAVDIRRCEFMRPITTEMYGIPPERVVGSSLVLDFRENGDGGDVLTKSHLNVLDDGPAKPAAIWSRIGKRPILAAGNSNGDIPLLQFANKPPRRALRLLVLHDDARREFDYTAGAEKSLELAKQYGWTLVSMKNDWKEVFG